jgi:hypothetical protein
MPLVYSDYVQVNGILDWLGITDPLAHYPNQTPQQIFAYLNDKIPAQKAIVDQISLPSRQGPLLAQWQEIDTLRRQLQLVFAPGATPGARDIDSLRTLAGKSQDWFEAIRAAVAEVGTRPVPIPVAPQLPRQAGMGGNWIWWGLAAFGVWAIFAHRE